MQYGSLLYTVIVKLEDILDCSVFSGTANHAGLRLHVKFSRPIQFLRFYYNFIMILPKSHILDGESLCKSLVQANGQSLRSDWTNFLDTAERE